MQLKSWTLSVALAAAFTLTGCNIFNPDGAAKASCSGSDIECYMALGQALIQEKDFEGAMDAYEKAVALDSTRSEAYWGYGRSAVYAFNINMGNLLADMAEAGNNNIGAFMEHPDEVLTKRIQLAYEVVTVMDKLIDRDTLNTAWKYLSDSTRYKSRPDYARRVAFIQAYFQADTAGPSRKREMFPLTDGQKTFEGLLVEFTAYKMIYKIMDFNDVGRDRIFNESDRALKGILKSDGTLGNLEDLVADMENDTALQNDVNGKILDLQNGMGDIKGLLAMLGGSDTASGAQKQTKEKMDLAVSGLGGTMVFYQFGDGLDNDGDGCIDEEIADSLDNDLDGFYDEDARVVGGQPGSITGDGVNNDRRFGTDDAQENKFDDNPGVLTFVLTSGLGADWVKIKKGSTEIDTRIAVQSDSLAVRLVPGQPVPAQYQSKLQFAKDNVGGCWRNY